MTVTERRPRDRPAEGVAFAPFHWGALHAPAGAGQLNATTHGARDPASKQPELKAAAVRLERVRAGAVARPRASRPSRRLVVLGTGMAAMETVEELLRRAPEAAWRMTMLGEEPGVPFNRMLLSKLLAGTVGQGNLELRPPAWFAQRGVDLRGGSPAAAIDLHERRVHDRTGIAHRFDALVIATGSRPFVPPIAGADRPGVLSFRTRADVAAIAASAQAARAAVVIGGGLLGLEAAAGIRACGAPVTVLEAAERLMPQQLDAAASRLLARALGALGIRSVCGARVERIDETGVVVAGRDVVAADLVVVAAGIRPETTLAAQAGLEVRRGVVVDDQLRASAHDVWAVGECAEHRGTVYGLWAPIAEQARVAGAAIAGDPAGFHGLTTATNLKVAGVDLFAGGEKGADAIDELVWSDGRRGVYRRLLLDGDRLAGAILVGDTTEARELSLLLRTGEPVPERFLDPPGAPVAQTAPQPSDVVCACNGVSRGAIEGAIAANGLTSLAAVGRATRAATGCGSCAADVERLLAEHREGSSSRNTSVTGRKPPVATIGA